jgi:hypothetical protein
MAITGIHTLLYTSEPEALRATLRDVFGWDHMDAGGGWLIFRTPPAEMGVHPGDAPAHQISLMCDDLPSTVAELRAKGIEFVGEPLDEGFGITIHMILPGGVDMQLYEPRHASPST